MDKIKNFRDLVVWQRAVELAVHIYKVTEQFPKAEAYGLTNQMRRASVSVASNIAEGYNRSQAELSHFLDITRGSLAELETQLEISLRVGYLPQQDQAVLLEEVHVLGRQLNVFHQRVEATLNR